MSRVTGMYSGLILLGDSACVDDSKLHVTMQCNVIITSEYNMSNYFKVVHFLFEIFLSVFNGF